MDNLPAYPAGVPHIGLFAINFAASPVPVDLSIIGAPGCSFYPALAPSPTVITAFEALTFPGTIELPLNLPGGIAGADVFVQGAALHLVLPPNSVGLTFTNGVCMKVGSL